MINILEQEKLFNEIGKILDKKIECFAIGGTAMMFLGLKDLTKDIDLVFLTKEDRELWKKAALSLGYKEMESRIIYGRRNNVPDMVYLGDWRIDLFLTEVISFSFSEIAQKRSVEVHEFSNNLIINIANPNDIFLMKCATERQKDIDDAKAILDKNLIKWDMILEEVQNQVNHGKIRIALDLGLFLENLENIGEKIPKEVMDSLFKILENQAKERRRK